MPCALTWIGLFSVLLGVPLAVLPEAAGPYDDPKSWALSILAAGTGLAWLAGAPGRGQRPATTPDRLSRAVRALVLACLSWMALTTLTSIAPLQSVLGSFGRGMGLLTVGSAVLLFFVIQSECRSARAVRALIDVALLGSVPVCLMAFGQVAGWDPLPKPWDPAIASLTVRSTLGSHIFLGSYLVGLIPLCAARLEWALRQKVESGRWPQPTRAQRWHAAMAVTWALGAVVLIGVASRWPLLWWALLPWGIAGAAVWAHRLRRGDEPMDTRLTAGALSGLLAGQVLVVLLSRGRGAFIGMLVGMGVTGLAILIRRGARRPAIGVGLGLAGLVVFLTLLNLPGSPVASLGELPLLRRLADIANVRHGSPGWFRLQVWRGIAHGWRRQLGGEETFPDLSPRARSLIGYGPETQLLVLDPLTTPYLGTLRARTTGWQARYVADRAHNYVLDHLVTEGVVGAGLYVLLAGVLVAAGISRIRTGGVIGEVTVRMGALGAVLAHLVDGQVGIETSMSLTVFWVVAAVLTGPPWSGPAVQAPPAASARGDGEWRVVQIVIAACLAGLAVWASTRWLLASVAYADGTRHAMAGRMVAAHEEFRASMELMPWLGLPAEAVASAALRLAGSEPDPARRADMLHEAEAALTRARSHALSSAGTWALAGQVALAEARAGDRAKLTTSRDAFVAALRLRPEDPALLAQLAWVWLESGDPSRARRTADEALARDHREWLAWAALARSARDLGDLTASREAAGKARAFTPAAARALIEVLLQ